MNACTSLLLYIQPNRNSLMLAKDNNTSDYFMYYKEEKYPLGNKKQDVEEDQKDLISKSLVNENVRDMLFERTSQDRLLGNELLSFLKEVKFSE